MDVDPYESITKECRFTILQEVKLGRCGFAFEPEPEEPSPPCPVQLTGITMVSPPESASEYVEEEIFHTPPEHHQSRSVDDPVPEIRPEIHQTGQKSDVGFDDDVSRVEVELKGKKVESKFTSGNVDLGETEAIVIESGDVEIAETEVVDLSGDENVVECETSRGRLGSKNVEDLHAFRYVSTSGGVGTSRCVGTRGGVSARRELPNSFKEPEAKEGLWVPRRSFRDNETFKGLVNATGIVSGGSTDKDYIKAAKERGLVFYRPRWWPKEGFGDQVMD